MKTKLLFGAMLLVGVSASAQQSVVKDAERAAKGGKSAAEVITIITPAFSHPETASDPKTWFIPGEASFKEYDDMFALKQFNKLPAGGDLIMANDLVNGYGLLNTVFQFDSIPNVKGKVDPKYSKKVINTIGGHFKDFYDAGYSFYQGEEYGKAVEAWDIYIDLVNDNRYAKTIPAESRPNDTIVGETRFNQALAAYFDKKPEQAIKFFYAAKDKGYNKKTLFDYAITVASSIPDKKAMFDFAEAALPLYGNEDPNYIGQMIMSYIEDKKYDEGVALVDKAISDNPGNSQYYVIKGVLLEQIGKPKAEIKESFKKAVEIDSENPQAQYNYGRIICEEAYEINDNAPVQEAAYKQVYESEILPRFNEAVDHLEKAYELDNTNTNALYYLQNVYYNLHNEAKENEIKMLLGM